jgi:CheY-like chemotaxis protein/HPt (histidine-containing phosphotransfer) domain-containing protein
MSDENNELMEFALEALDELVDHCIDGRDTLFNRQDKENGDLVRRLFQLIHGIKGTSMAIGLENVAELAHKVEDQLICYRDDSESVPNQLLDFIDDFFNMLEEKLISKKENFNSELDIATIAEQYEYILHSLDTNQKSDSDRLISTDSTQKQEKKLRILLVDDEPDLLKLMSFQLKENFSNCEIVFAENGELASSICQEFLFDLILTDHKMPKKNGKELVEEIRFDKTHTNYATPIIFITAYKPDLGANGDLWKNVFFVGKPYNEDQLIYYAKCGLFNKSKFSQAG